MTVRLRRSCALERRKSLNRNKALKRPPKMYHSSHTGLRAEASRLHLGQTSVAAGKGGATSLYGGGSQQSGQYPSPYQTRQRLHSSRRHDSRGQKRGANNGNTGGDGAVGGRLVPALTSASAYSRVRAERDRFLVDINAGGQRGGVGTAAVASNQLSHARRDASGGEGTMNGSGGMWLSQSSPARFSNAVAGGRPDIGSPSRLRASAAYGGGGAGGVSFGNAMAGRSGDAAAVAVSKGGEGFPGDGRLTIPQRYSRSRERIYGMGGAVGTASSGVSRRAVRHRGISRGNELASTADARRKLPLIGGGGGMGTRDGMCRTMFPNSQRLCDAAPGKELVIREEGCNTSAVCTIQGLKPGNPRWENQDNYVMEEGLNGSNVRAFVVFDGHGEMGHLVSRRCVERLPKLLVDSNFVADRAILKLSDDLRACPVDCSSSGATCVLVTIIGNKVCVANLGDSKCVLGKLVNDQICAVRLSEDHKPDRPDERQRILDIGGQVGSRHLVVGANPSGPIRVPMGPARVWYRCRGEVMGLAMSRSLGDDVAHQAGVSSEPEIMEHQLDEKDQFLILGTDGVWDVIEVGQAVQIVQGYASRFRGSSWDPQGAASLLSHTARKRWEGLSTVVDDITAVVVRLNIS